MITEILRLRDMGLDTGKIANALCISRNTVKSYIRQHDAAVACGLAGPVAEVVSPPKYSAPWAPLVDWEAVKAATDQGEALCHHWERHVTSRDIEMDGQYSKVFALLIHGLTIFFKKKKIKTIFCLQMKSSL